MGHSSVSTTTPHIKKTKKKETKNNKELYELRKQERKLENKVNNLEKKIVTIELQFSDLVYGTQEFELHQSKLRQHKTSRKDLITEWERIQKKIETLSK